MIHSIIIDDEPNCCEVLQLLLKKYCPEVEVLSVCYSGEEGLRAIKNLHPNLVFLDVEMPGMNGFEMLEQLKNVDFALIFTTSFDRYALKAFQFSALDYLLKPIDHNELQKAIQKTVTRLQLPMTEQLEILLQKIQYPSKPLNKIALPTLEGMEMVTVDVIISCQSDSNYTMVYLKNKQKLTISRTLKDIEEMLQGYAFARVHHSHLVNLNEVSKYVKGDGGFLIMSDGSHVDVSRRMKEELMQKLIAGRV